MKFINREEVPLYLQKGAFYEALDPKDYEKFGVPSNCLKLDLTITSPEDLKHLLFSLRFWGINGVPAQELPEYEEYFRGVLALRGSKPEETVYLAITMKFGVHTVKVLHESMKLKMSSECWTRAARVDDAATMAYLEEKNVPKEVAGSFAIMDAATHGSVRCLKFMHINNWKIPDEILVFAADNGRLECVKFLREVCRKQYTKGVMICAAQHGQLDLLRYLHETGCPWDAEVCAIFACNDQLECLKFAHEEGCAWDVRTCRAAAEAGHLRCLKYAHTQGCPWDATVSKYAISAKQRDCVNYAQQHGCPVARRYPRELQAAAVAFILSVSFLSGKLWYVLIFLISACMVHTIDKYKSFVAQNDHNLEELLDGLRFGALVVAALFLLRMIQTLDLDIFFED